MHLHNIVNKLLQLFSVTDLTALPHVLVELVEACYRVDATFDELAVWVEKDPAMCAQVLALAGSRGLLADRELLSFPNLLAKLGRHAIKALALTNATRQAEQIGNDEALDALIEFWKRSTRCALTSRQLARLTGYESPDEAYLAGLLHNIGQLVLASRHPQQFASLKAATQLDTQQLLLEQEQFGVGHTELGAELIESWGLNSYMADAARYHHQPLGYMLDAHPLVKVVFLADKLSHGESGPVAEAFAVADQLFGLGQGAVAELMSSSGEASSELGQSLDLRSGRAGDAQAEKMTAKAVGGKSAELADRVQQIALLDSLRPRCDGGENALLLALQSSLQLQTGCSRSACFLFDSESNVLRGNNPFASMDRIAGLKIALEAGRSLVAQSVMERQMLHSLSDDSPALTVVDRQILGCLQSEGILSLPLSKGRQPIGALVMGVNSEQVKRLESQAALLTAFAADAADDLLQQRASELSLGNPVDSSNVSAARTRQIVHEVNNPLSIVRNYMQVLGMKLGGDHPAQKDLQIMQEELVRMAGLMQQLVEQEKPELTREPVVINSLVADVARLAGESVLKEHTIAIELDLDRQLPPVLSNASALKQILINLTRNAGEALGHEGKIRIRTRDWFQVDATPYVEIEVSDDGPGIPLVHQEGLFRPMTTTKGEGHSGIGLSIVKELVEELGGSIGFNSSEGTGTSFRLLLPRILAERRDRTAESEPNER